MRNYRPVVLWAALVVSTAGCPAPDPGQAPLFNAIDPSLQCEAGKIGWDFSTGGNNDAIRRNSVGGTIAITEASFDGGCEAGLADAFVSGCDGYETCTLPVPGCVNADVTLKYQCGTETATYQAQLEPGDGGNQITVACGSVITVVNAIYAPDAERPVDITNALASHCTGKRRCANGKSGFELNNYQDPQPNVAKKVQVTYVCDAEAREKTVVVDDFNLDFYCDNTASAPVSEIEFISIQTVVPRSTKTAFCGGALCSPAVRANFEKMYSDYAARLFDDIAAACDLKRDCSFKGPTELQGRNNIYRDIEEDVDGVDPIGIPLGPAALGLSYQEFYVGYTCGTNPEINWKIVPFPIGARTGRLNLQCGEKVHVTDVYVGQSQYTAAEKAETLAMFQADCADTRVCYAKRPRGRSYEWYFDANGQKRARSFQAKTNFIDVEYTCGDLDFSRKYVARIDFQNDPNHLECEPRRDDLLARGIRINSVAPASKTQEVTKLCFGRENCRLPSGDGRIDVTYRCGAGATLESISYGGVGNSGNAIDCRPAASFRERYVLDPNGNKVDFIGNRCEYFVYEDQWLGPGGTFIPDSGGRFECARYREPPCPFMVPYDSNGDGTKNASFDLCGVDEVYWTFQCGPDASNLQTFTSVRGENWNDDNFPVYPRYIENVSCDPPLSPYVNKKCVPKTCLGQTRRGDELDCEPDSSLVPLFAFTAPVAKNYLSDADGNPARWGGTDAIENGVTALRSGYPYQIFPLVSYQTPGGQNQPVPDDTDVSTWAYDVFQPIDPNDTSLQAEVFGFRCLVNSTSVGTAFTNYAGYWQMFAGGSPTTIPDSCYGHDAAKVNDPSTSWYDGAKRANMPESEFKQKYQRASTKLVGSLDAGGKNTVRWVGSGTYVAINPVGFFYDPVRDFIDTHAFYAQTADFGNQKTVEFIESKEIVIAAVRQTVTADAFQLDVNFPDFLPSIAVDFSWFLRGNSVKNPYSPDTRDANGETLSLKRDNLKAVVEIGYAEDGNTSWAPVDAARFDQTQSLSNHNVYYQTERLQLTVNQLLRARMMTVRGTNTVLGEKPEGWMKTFTDEDTVFKIRTCLVSDDFPFSLGGDSAAVASQTANDYTLTLSKRCSEPSLLVLKRELFVTPEPVATSGPAESEAASMGNSGDSEANSNGDNGTQSNCTIQCTTDADCGGATCSAEGRCLASPDQQRCASENRSSAGSGVGSVKLTLYSNRTDNNTTTEGAQTRNNTSNVTEMLGFAIMNVAKSAGASIEGAVSSYNFTLDVGLNVTNILDAARGLKSAPKAKTLFTFDLKETKRTVSAQQRYGIQFVIQTVLNFTIGPFPLAVVFSFTAAVTPHLTIELSGGRFTGPGDNPALSYPCFLDENGNGSKCFVAESAAKNFFDASEACKEKGGRLASVYTPEDAAAVASTASGSTQHWVGAVPQYLYQYAACADVGTPRATPIPAGHSCAQNSLTQYSWMTPKRGGGNPAFARQAGVSTTFSNVTLPAGLSMTPAASYVSQGLAGVYYQLSSSKLGHRPRSDQLAYVCEYDPASVVKANRQDISIALDIMAGLTIEACSPSEDFGVCLQGVLKFFTAEIRFGIELKRADIYGPSPTFAGAVVPYTTLSGTTLYGKLSASALALEFNAVLRFVFWDTTILIKKFDPVASWEKTLFQIPNNSYQSHLESP